ncbi:PREDICTED: uncharacterized protein LOC109582347 isoform X2 [Amphimedon queenslandica]|uniref:RanBP2-type domain-containing protein n=1 Tax=Amphimedon queenslandica TaxID=400682 RepID=A0A1X7URX8_AMPQE|nr:PREDICTED: uncharacterized protein LOC109582347 isoform X2 [Amphimedon queenslandica]|eukprot:XP_019852573.1 PREDICTED: uncharacterized protein LOC109582347 isoform X2 [Amphimedon queenslandica]
MATGHGPIERSRFNWGEKTPEDSDDDDFSSPGNLVIDSSYDESKASTPTTPKTTSYSLKKEFYLCEEDFKGLTFVGKMDAKIPPETICLYSYHWGSTHVDLITRINGDTLVPMTNVYNRVVPGLTRNAVSNRIPKIGAKSIALPESHINVLKKLQLPITARSHYLTIVDFIRLCTYYKQKPPRNLSDFAQINSKSNPADILKTYNSQVVPSQPALASVNSHLSTPPAHSSNYFSKDKGLTTPPVLSPGQINASLAMSMIGNERYSEDSPRNGDDNDTDNDKTGEVKYLQFPNGVTLSLVYQQGIYYILNTEIQSILPQANQNIVAPLRSLLNIPLEYASKAALNHLKSEGIVGIKACRVIIYKTVDVIKMYSHWNLSVPQYLTDLSNGIYPPRVVPDDPSINQCDSYSSLPGESLSSTPPVPSNDMMSPSGTKLYLGTNKKKERKTSHSGLSPLSDQDLDYNYLPWGDGRSITLLTPPSGEPYVAIAELVAKIFSQRSQVSLQKRTRLGVPTVPATSLQIHALRARGSIDPSSGYSKLIPLSGVIKLAKEAAIFIPPAVVGECHKYVAEEEIQRYLINSPVKTPPQSSPHRRGGGGSVIGSPLKTPLSVRPDVASHPDVTLAGAMLNTDEGVLFQVKWGEHKIAVFTSARNINYIGLYQIYEVLFKHLVTRMNFKMRMRKLGVKSIRAPSFIRQGLIRLGALPSSSPVCGLLRISEMERLVSSYDVKIPQVFYDLFINNALSVEPLEPDVFRDFTNTEEKFVVSYPRDRIDTSISDLVTESESLPPPSTPPTSSNNRLSYKNTSTLQSLAKKISMKNHRLAAAASATTSPTSIFAPVSHGKRKCYSCGRSYASSKKRCEDCGIFLVGYPCPVCGSINYTLCSKCTQCGAALDRTKLSSSTPTASLSPVVQKQTSLKVPRLDVPRFEVPRLDAHPNVADEKSDSQSDSSGDSDDHPKLPAGSFSAPPIRTAALKSMFPSKSTESSSSLVTKTLYSGNISSSRNCMECGGINPRKAKKCQQCKAPIQGRPCPQCNRPNHSHSTECFKCGTALPPTATKWVVGGRIFRTSNESGRLGMTTKQFKKAASDRAPITCIRCHRVRQYSRFKCGRCGDLYSATPLYSSTTGTTNNGKHATTTSSVKDKQQSDINDPDNLLKFAQNLVLLGLGEELLPTLSEKEEELRQMLYPAEEELEAAEEECQSFLNDKSSKESLEADLKAQLDILILKAEKYDQELKDLKEREEAASHTMEVCPDMLKELEEKLNAYTDLYDISPV